ncbi:MAG: SEC-C domain-containing protein [Flavisolibacter sp.]|nr:SEC-C domain-containing protein [Flavisolibacter sp.]MBD0296693.1 SEC-C domain-containing protein [Flavisolibacter sp.]
METDDADREFSRKRELQDIYAIIDELRGFEERVKQEENDEEDMFDDYEEIRNEVDKGTLFYSSSQPFKKEEKIGRNDPCPCGSGLKYKKCHGKTE